MATPGSTPVSMTLAGLAVPSTMKASVMPGSFLIWSMLALATLPPTDGHLTSDAYSMPGRFTSMANSGLPVTSSRLSTPVKRLPISL